MENRLEIKEFCIPGHTPKVLQTMKEEGYEPLSVKETREYWKKRFAGKSSSDFNGSERFDFNFTSFVSLKKPTKKPIKNLLKRAKTFFGGRRYPIHPNYYFCISGDGEGFINTDLWGSINIITPAKKIKA